MANDASDGSDGRAAKPECFVMMPISDPEGYAPGHFERVYRDIFAPACEQAGYVARLASEVQETNLIHLDVLQRILTAPMALCDLSSRNPNVLFELGLRQAFDKPVILVQEMGTPRIFDINPLRTTDYRPTLLYHEVVADQRKIADAIAATRDASERGDTVNSIVRLLALTRPATLPDVKDEENGLLQIIRAEMSALRAEFREAFQPGAVRSLSGAEDWLPSETYAAGEVVKGMLLRGDSRNDILEALTGVFNFSPEHLAAMIAILEESTERERQLYKPVRLRSGVPKQRQTSTP